MLIMADKNCPCCGEKYAKSSDFKILSLSGGGYRGLYTAEVLKELENYLKK